ncbi:MAG TPA: 4-alpha-glucanotransferase [Acidimicrobiales bacterium]|jgi:4-alpha-glucanotransferase|nr:4-alpha-glucanotransferase [Acidimicrobiales bacterium]
MTDAERWGIQPGYHDVSGTWHQAPEATVEAFLHTMGAEGAEPPPGPAIIAGPGRPHPHLAPGELRLEDGATIAVVGDLPYDLPLGYHRYLPDERDAVPLIVTPGRCFLPDDLRAWGWAAQLYASRSRASWGMGDLADLARLGRWSAGQGASVALINPLHAALPVGTQEPSPYFASSRAFRNPIYLRIEDVPGAADLPNLAELAAAGRALNAERRIDRDQVWRLKSDALEAMFDRFRGHEEFDRFLAREGTALEQYATFCALCEVHGVPWEKWPPEVRHPEGAGVASFAASDAGARRILYHSWLQWLLDRQLAAAGETIGLVQDLAIGADVGGADAWRWQDCLALDARVGAPPDEFNVEGQNWALPPFDPWKLRSAGYQPFIELVRAGLCHTRGMRFDHVMGLFRLFWIPADGSPRDGTYVHYQAEDLLDILALESQRAGAFVVGEDLGTVEEAHRVELAQRRVLSYRLLWFEPSPPGEPGDGGEGTGGAWPRQALAAATTHDLPTVAGLWTGADVEARRRLGLPINEEAEAGLRAKIRDWVDADDGLPAADFVERVYRLLGRAPCALLTATVDDALVVEERPNLPGTVDEWPNWRIALPAPLEDLETSPLAKSIAAALRRDDPPPAS